jgi:translation initiation factor 1
MTDKSRSRLVYTTDPDPEEDQQPEPSKATGSFPSANKQTARIMRDRKGRGGKTVTVISGLKHDPDTLDTLLKQLKQQCGSGGTRKGDELEIQGDHREKVAQVLGKLGYKTKLIGG